MLSLSLLVKIYDDKYNDEINSLHKNKECNYVMETNNSINYLYLTLMKNCNTNNIEIVIKRKPSSNTIAMHRKSIYPQTEKNKHNKVQFID